MFRPRIIPVLLLRQGGLVKTVRFSSKPTYVGDPINAVRIFNDLEADELIFLDHGLPGAAADLAGLRARRGRGAEHAVRCRRRIRTLEDIRRILEGGAEKVVLNTVGGQSPEFIAEAADAFGLITVVSIDARKRSFGKLQSWVLAGRSPRAWLPRSARMAEARGAGEDHHSVHGPRRHNAGLRPRPRAKRRRRRDHPRGGAGRRRHRRGPGAGDSRGMPWQQPGARRFQRPMRGVLINYPEEFRRFVQLTPGPSGSARAA